jgi:hypothetical protein
MNGLPRGLLPSKKVDLRKLNKTRYSLLLPIKEPDCEIVVAQITLNQLEIAMEGEDTESTDEGSADQAYAKALQIVEEARRTSATQLELSGYKLNRLPSLAGLVNLEDANFAMTREVLDWSPLRNLKALRTLNLSGTNIASLSPLAHLTELRELHCSFTDVSDLMPLAGLVKLEMINLTATMASELSPLANLSALEVLWLDGTEVSDLSPISGLMALQDLHIEHTKVADLLPLAELTSLVASAIRLFGHRGFSDLVPMNIRGLHFGGCPLSDAVLLKLAEKDTPECTVETIQYLRRQKGFPELKLRPPERKTPGVDWKYGGYTLVEDEQG